MTPADLRASRLALGLSQWEAAEAIGISHRQWQYLEAGRDSHGKPLPEVPKLYAMAWSFLGCIVAASIESVTTASDPAR